MSKHLYMMMGYPGSGKTTYVKNLTNILNQKEDTCDIFCRDEMINNVRKTMGANKTRTYVHQVMIDKITNMQKDHLLVDSVNGHYDGRLIVYQTFLKYHPEGVIHIIFFEPSKLIFTDVKEYVKILHRIRQHHHLFPESFDDACRTVENIVKHFEEPCNVELTYDVQKQKSYID